MGWGSFPRDKTGGIKATTHFFKKNQIYINEFPDYIELSLNSDHESKYDNMPPTIKHAKKKMASAYAINSAEKECAGFMKDTISNERSYTFRVVQVSRQLRKTLPF
jgi:hypothetical protein